jgi:hypothetical protein
MPRIGARRIMEALKPRSLMNLTLAQLAPVVCSAFAAAAMVRLGETKKMLVIRRPERCAACRVVRHKCRCVA